MAVVRRIAKCSNFYVSTASSSESDCQHQKVGQASFVGEWMWLDGERTWVWVNVMECTSDDLIEQQKYYPTEKACYSHSPPDMELSIYNHKRHQITFVNRMQHLYSRLQNLVAERRRQMDAYKQQQQQRHRYHHVTNGGGKLINGGQVFRNG